MDARVWSIFASLLVACTASGTGTGTSVASNDGGDPAVDGGGSPPPYSRLIELTSACVETPFVIDTSGRIMPRYVLAYPAGYTTECIGKTLDEVTRAAIVRDLKTELSLACEIPQFASKDLDGGSCVQNVMVGWCYVANFGDPMCPGSAFVSVGASAGAATGLRVVLLVP